jgi:FAD/FMN-containing dehydrogenase
VDVTPGSLLWPLGARAGEGRREHDVREMKVMNFTDEPPNSDEKTFERVAYRSEIYPIESLPNFRDLEYAIPVESGKEALRQIRELIILDVDAILRQYGARPHWGKLHFSRAEDMPSLYPRFHDFGAILRRMDPWGRFLNDHLRNLFE